MKNNKKNRKKVFTLLAHLINDHCGYYVNTRTLKMFIKNHPINEWL